MYIAFDQDDNQAGQKAAHQLAHAPAERRHPRPHRSVARGLDPNSYFVAGASAADFTARLREADRL